MKGTQKINLDAIEVNRKTYKTRCFNLSDDAYNKINKIASEKNISMSKLLEQIINNFI